MSNFKRPPNYRRLYKTYHHMLDRCYRNDNKDYPMWGGRGINNDEGYSPNNCRWVDRKNTSPKYSQKQTYYYQRRNKMPC